MKEFLKFKKSKYPIIKIAFFSLIVFILYSFIVAINYHPFGKNLPMYGSSLENITLNVTFKNHHKVSPFICLNDFCSNLDPDNFNNVYIYKYNSDNKEFYNNGIIKQLALIYPTDTYKKTNKTIYDYIESIYLHVGMTDYYFSPSEIKKFKTKQIKMKLDESGSVGNYEAIIFPDTVKTNLKQGANRFTNNFLSLFYNWQSYIIPYFWAFIAFLMFVFYKDEIIVKSFKIEPKYYKYIGYIALGLILIIACVLRGYLFNYYPLWIDEVYTKNAAILSFKSCFEDPGNPPLFFILEFIISKIFGISDTILKIVPYICGCGFVYLIYLIFNRFGKKSALFASFFASVNIINISLSQEARSGTLCALLICSMIYFLFKWLDKFEKKDLIGYFISIICAINTHYFLVIFAFTNFIWGIVSIFDIKPQDKYKKIKDFVVVNLIAAITFVPYLIISSKAALTKEFNAWILPLSKEVFGYVIKEYFISKYLFVALCLILLVMIILSFLKDEWLDKINLQRNKEKETFFIYLIYSLALVLIIASMISIFIKPIIHKRILLSCYALLFMIEAISIITIFEIKRFNKFMYSLKVTFSLILILTCFSFTKPMPLRNIYSLEPFMTFVANDSKEFNDNGYEIHAIIPCGEKYVNNYPETKKLDYIKWHYISADTQLGKIKKSDYIDKNKKGIIYISGLAGAKLSVFNPFTYFYSTNLDLNQFAKLKYDK